MAVNREVRLRIGRRVKRLRLQRGLSQEQLAERVGNSDKHISQVERGVTNVTIDVLSAVAKELSVDVAELFFNPRAPVSSYVITRQDLDRIAEIVTRVKRRRGRRSK